jgi:predicted dehydrogenase
MAKAGPIRLGIVGLGRAGWGMHCPELKGKEDKFQIVAACDVLKERRDRMAAACGCKVYEKIADLVADPAVEMVDVATFSRDHFGHAVMALKAGKHVFLEKPITETYAQARRLVAAAARAKGKLYIRHNSRCDKAFLHVREIIASGLLGDVYQIRLTRGWYARRDDWQTLARFGGGLLLNWGPHLVDHALRLLEAPVARQWSDLKRIAAVGDAEDHFKIVLEGTNGRVVDLEFSGGMALGGPLYQVWGTRGALRCDAGSITLRYLSPRAKLPPRKVKPGAADENFGSPENLPWIEETFPVNPKKAWSIWDVLYAAVRKGKRFPITLDEAVGVMQVISAAKKGSRFARPWRSVTCESSC